MVASRVWRAGRFGPPLADCVDAARGRSGSIRSRIAFSAFGGFGLVIIYSGFTILPPRSGSIGKQAAFREWDGRGRKISSSANFSSHPLTATLSGSVKACRLERLTLDSWAFGWTVV